MCFASRPQKAMSIGSLIATSMIKLGIVHDHVAVAGKQQFFQIVLVCGPSSVAGIQDLISMYKMGGLVITIM